MIFVTAANSAYFNALANLVGSVHFWAPDHEVLVYDLGLANTQRQEILGWQRTRLVSQFIADDAPAHCWEVHLYAWKPIAIVHALERHPVALWIDAGSELRSPVQEIEQVLVEDGHFFVQGQDLDMTQMSHDGCYRSLGAVKDDYRGQPHYAGNLQGYVRDGEAHQRVLKPLQACALQRDCIAPPGSDLSNHRFDQTALSILIRQSGLAVVARTELLSAGRAGLSPDPKQAGRTVVHTARGASSDYVDQLRTKARRRRSDFMCRPSSPDSFPLPDSVRNNAPLVVCCTSHFFEYDYVQPFDLPKHWGLEVSCDFTEDRSLIYRADALWFHGPSIRTLPKAKVPQQRWILMSMESDENYPLLQNPAVLEMFDLHMTYRLDSDIPVPYPNWVHYGDLTRPALPPSEKGRGLAPVAYIASNPVPERDRFVAELMRWMPVDSYGKCLNNKHLPGFVSGDDIWQRGGFGSILEMLPRYKFYIVYENSATPDYVTERLFHALGAGVVPVYLGAENVREFLPDDNAVIHVRDFPSCEALAEYLQYLDSHDEEYLKHLQWKERELRSGFKRLLDVASVDPRLRMALKVAHGCDRSCRCGGRIRDGSVTGPATGLSP